MRTRRPSGSSPTSRSNRCLVAAALLVFAVSGVMACGGVSVGICWDWWCVGPPIYPPCYDDPFCYLAADGGDLDGDGIEDAITVGRGSVRVRLGDGAGALGAPTTYAFDLGTADFVRVADVDGDGNRDLILIHASPARVQALLGNGTGGLPTNGPVVPVPGTTRILDVAVGTFDGGPAEDLVVLDDAGGATVLLGAAGGAFTVAPAGRQVLACGGDRISAGTIDGDALSDIVVSNAATWSVCAYMAGGTGAFTPLAGPLPVSQRPDQPLLAELDGQPGLDLAVLQQGGASVRVWRGNGAGGFTPTAQGPVATHVGGHRLVPVPDPAAPAGPVHLAVLGGGSLLGAVKPLPNLGDGTLDATQAAVSLSHAASAGYAVDLDGDGRIEFVVVSSGGGTILQAGTAQD